MPAFEIERLLRIAHTVEREGLEALSDDDRAYFEEATEAFQKTIKAITPEQDAAFQALKSLPEEIAKDFGDWTLSEFALLWPLIRTQLYAQGPFPPI